jgi:magnesium transporter
MQTRKPAVNLHETVEQIAAMIEHHRALETLARRQDTATAGRGVADILQRRQNEAELQRRVRDLHPADLAFVLDTLPPEDRLQVWRALDVQQAAEMLVELDAATRTWVIDQSDERRLTRVASALDPDDLAWIAEELPAGVMEQVRQTLDEAERHLLQQTDTLPPHTVGRLMSVDLVAVRDSQTVTDVLSDLRGRDNLPDHLDRLFVVDVRNVLRGAISLQALIVAGPDTVIGGVMEEDPLSFRPDDTAAHAAHAFERYDFVSAPVISERGKLIGRLTVDAVVDFIRVTADQDALAMAGLRGGEDLFAPAWHSARNRSLWLFVNLVTAFVATRFIGLFESTIQEVVALATLMPIVASMGGNTGNQTVALVIRELAYEQLTDESRRHLLRKEMIVSLLNGIVWGGAVGLIAALVYQWARLGMVMTGAVMLNLVIAAGVGVLVPLTLERAGRDPAQGSSVLLTFITDSMGFFLFLGLARMFL